ncbi:MAG: DUF6337 family protein [Fidelibacterota bacterium]
MSDFLGPLILVTFCFIVSYWERSRYGTAVTPFGVMVWPYTVVVLMINLLGKQFGFFAVSPQSITFIVVSYTFFLVGGQLIIPLFRKSDGSFEPEANTAKNVSQLFDIYRPLFVFLALVAIVSGLLNFRLSIGELGWVNIGSEEFAIAYGTGWLSHIQNLSRLSFIFLMGDYLLNRKKHILILLVLVFLIILIRQVKYHIFGIVLGAYFFCLLNGIIRFSIRKILLYSLTVFILFSATYYIGFLVVGLDYTFAARTNVRLLNHFFTYLFGGPIAFSEILTDIRFPIYSPQEIIAVPINLYRFLTGDHSLIDIIIHNWVPVSHHTDMHHTANIFGAVGMLYMYLGKYLAWVYMFFLGIFSYFLWGISLRVRESIGVQLVYGLIMAFLTVSFFDLYFNKLVTYEATFYMLVIPPVYLLLRGLVHFSLTLLRS